MRQNLTGVSVAEIFNKWADGQPTCSLHSRSGTFSLQNFHFRKRKIMLEAYTRPRGRCFLVSIKKFKTCIFRSKFLATTICHLATENFYPVASCRTYKKVNFGPCDIITGLFNLFVKCTPKILLCSQ